MVKKRKCTGCGATCRGHIDPTGPSCTGSGEQETQDSDTDRNLVEAQLRRAQVQGLTATINNLTTGGQGGEAQHHWGGGVQSAPQFGTTAPQFGTTAPQFGTTLPQFGTTLPQSSAIWANNHHHHYNGWGGGQVRYFNLREHSISTVTQPTYASMADILASLNRLNTSHTFGSQYTGPNIQDLRRDPGVTAIADQVLEACLLYTSPSPRD